MMDKGNLTYWYDEVGDLHSIFAVGAFIGREKVTPKERGAEMISGWEDSERQGKIRLTRYNASKRL